MKTFFAWCAVMGVGMMGAGSVVAGEIHVSGGGDDARSGATAAQAVRSLERGLALVRASDAPRRLVLHDGTWENVQLVLGPEDSGLEIVAAPEARPRLLGGKILRDWKADGEGLVAAPVPGTKDHKWDFRVLVAGAKLAPRSRLPETGWLKHESQFNAVWAGEQEWRGADKPETKDRLRYRAQDKAAWMDGHNAELTILQEWDDSLVGVARHDPATRTLFFTNPAGHPPGAWKHYDYCVWNVREGLTHAGQWYLDRDREVVVYRVNSGEDLAKAEVIAPVYESVIIMRGEDRKPIKNVRLSGLSFSATTPPLATGGWGGTNYAGAVEMVRAENCVVADCAFSAVGGQAVRSTQGKGNRIVGNRVSECGTGGIYGIDGVGEVIADNTVVSIGRFCNGAIGIRAIGNGYGEAQLASHDNVVEHNLVTDCPYVGIEFGGTSNVYQFNRVERAMLVLQDGAGIYGSGKKLMLRQNVIRDIPAANGRKAHGFYIDENGEGIVFEGNLVLDCPSALLMHKCRNNTLKGNLLASSTDLGVQFFSGCKGFVIDGNVFYAGTHIWARDEKAAASWAGNIAWSVKGEYKNTPADLPRQDPGVRRPGDSGPWQLDSGGLGAKMLPGLMDVLKSAGPRTPTGSDTLQKASPSTSR